MRFGFCKGLDGALGFGDGQERSNCRRRERPTSEENGRELYHTDTPVIYYIKNGLLPVLQIKKSLAF